MATTARVLQLLSLLQTRRTWSGPELISRLEVSERTLRRDVDRLRELGYPVHATTGPAGGYRLEAGADIPPLLLDDEEAVAIAIGLRTAAGGSVTGIEETSVRALAKLEQILPPRIRQRVNALQATIVPMFRPWVTVDSATLATVAQASRDHERIRFAYRAYDGAETERNVEPHRLVSVGQRWYLLAFDRERDDWRMFRIDRIADPWPTRTRFKPRRIPGGDAGEFVMQSLGSRPMRYQAEFVLRAPADEVRSRISSGTVEPRDATSCIWRTQGDQLLWLAMGVLWLEVEFETVGPPELVEFVTDLAARLARSVPAG